MLFVCPTSKLASNYGDNGCTINRFFFIGMTEDSEMARFDDSPYETIVFDESSSVASGSLRGSSGAATSTLTRL